MLPSLARPRAISTYVATGLLLLTALVPTSGCAPAELRWEPTNRLHPELSPGPLDAPPNADAPSQATAEGALSLPQALALALERSPELATFAWEVRARDAAALQASLPPNPELEAEFEDLGLASNAAGSATATSTLRVGLTLTGPGVLRGRTRTATLERDLAAWEYEAARADVLTETTVRFVEVLAAQRRLEVAGDMDEMAGTIVAAVALQVEAGQVSPVEETRAATERGLARIDLDRAGRDLRIARRHLAACWGAETSPTFDAAVGDLEAIAPLPELALLDPVDGPELARQRAEHERLEARVRLARAEGLPELGVGGGVQVFGATGEAAGVVGLSLELPLFDANQGAVREALARQARGDQEARALRTQLGADLEEAWHDLASAHAEVELMQGDVLPRATQTHDAVLEAYRHGRLALMDVFDARRTLAEVRLRGLEALVRYHRAAATVERLTGRALPAAALEAEE
jgi:outer membrane protein, heavy metal efflux system